jgi:hypothetical protein
VLAFSLLFTSCGGTTGESGNPDTGATGNGAITSGSNGIWSITAPVMYDQSISNLTEAKSKTDFSYCDTGPINDCIPNSSVTVSGGNVTIKLGIPKSEYLDTTNSWIYGGLTINPASVKVADVETLFFSTSDESYYLFCIKDKSNLGLLFYVDKDVTINGTTYSRYGYNSTIYSTDNYNLSMKAGWNYIIGSISGTEYNKTCTFSSYQSLPSGFSWKVVDEYVGDGELFYRSGSSGGMQRGHPDYNSINEFQSYLISQPENTPSNPYYITVQLTENDSLYYLYGILESRGYNKYVSLNLTGTFTSVGNGDFWGSNNLIGITIPSSVTNIGNVAFVGTKLTSVTFAAGSNISNANFGSNAFPEGNYGSGGDSLKNAYAIGKAGTYTRTAGGSTWTKQ